MTKALAAIALLASIPLTAGRYDFERPISKPVLVSQEAASTMVVAGHRSVTQGTRVATVWWRTAKYRNPEVYLRVIDTAAGDAARPQAFVGTGSSPIVASDGVSFFVFYYDGESIAMRTFDRDGAPRGEATKIIDAPIVLDGFTPWASELLSVFRRPATGPGGDSWNLLWSEPESFTRLRRMQVSSLGAPLSDAETVISGVDLLAVAQSADSTLAIWSGPERRAYCGVWMGERLDRIVELPRPVFLASAAWNGSSFGVAVLSTDSVNLIDLAETVGAPVPLFKKGPTAISKLDLEWTDVEYTLASVHGVSGPDGLLRVDHITVSGQSTRAPESQSLRPWTTTAGAVQLEDALVTTEGRYDVIARITQSSQDEERLLSWQAMPQHSPVVLSEGVAPRTVLWAERGVILGRAGDSVPVELAHDGRWQFEATAIDGHVYLAWASVTAEGAFSLHLTDWDQASGVVRSSQMATSRLPEIAAVISDGTAIFVAVRHEDGLVLERAPVETLTLERWYSGEPDGESASLAWSDCCIWLASTATNAIETTVLDRRTAEVMGRRAITTPAWKLDITTEGDELLMVHSEATIEFQRIDRTGTLLDSRVLVPDLNVNRNGLRIAGAAQNRFAIWSEYPGRLSGYAGVPLTPANLEIKSVPLYGPSVVQTTVLEGLPYVEESMVRFDAMGSSFVYARHVPELGFAPRVFLRLPPSRSRAVGR